MAFALLFGVVNAQDVNMHFIPSYKPNNGGLFNIENAMQQSNGDVVSNVVVGTSDAQAIGNIFYKVSPQELQFTDSLFVADTFPPYYLFAKDPRCGGNIRVNIEPDGNGGTALRISHFPDNDLSINSAEDLVVQLCDTVAFGYFGSYMIDSQNDLIIKYYTGNLDGGYACHISRVGLDGTIKHSAILPQSQNFLTTMDEFTLEPRKYYQWSKNETGNLSFYVFDSVFQMENYYIFNKLLQDTVYVIYDNEDTLYIPVREEFAFGDSNANSTFVFPLEGDLLVVAPYSRDTANYYDYLETGLALARYNIRTMQRTALIHFNDQPGPSTDAHCMCFKMTSDGNFYLVYREPTPGFKPTMNVVKLDMGLNQVWKRYCYEQSYSYDPYIGMHSDILNNPEGLETGIYIVGYAANAMHPGAGVGIFHFFLTDDGLTTLQEGNIAIRPYTFFPNPVQDQLHLQYSPDVEPKQVELYDLQGRLVRSKTNALESLNMEGLAAGQYVMKVTLEDGTVYTDKVVKE